MNQADIITYILRRNQDFIVTATDGLSQADSLLHLPGESNCMNWVLGHITVYRDQMLACVQRTKCMTASEVKLYIANSKPISPASKSCSLERLLKLLAQGFDALSIWLECNSGGLQQGIPPEILPRRGEKVVEYLTELCWHESHHVGELHALRELAVVNRGKGWK